MYIEDTKIPIPLWKIFKIELRKQGRSIEWLADMIGLGYQHTRRLISDEYPITKENAQKISEVLNLPINAE